MSASPIWSTQASKRSRAKDVNQDIMTAEGHNRSKRRKFSSDGEGTTGFITSVISDELSYDGSEQIKRESAQSQQCIEQTRSTLTRWSLYHTFSGYISNIEPIFSPDEK